MRKGLKVTLKMPLPYVALAFLSYPLKKKALYILSRLIPLHPPPPLLYM